ncbi:MAG: hypothetical protein KGJ08_02375 [Gammaproteobacteria bacterium]|nr:hypothetical protein [Gammaproteobacteria bacterium]
MGDSAADLANTWGAPQTAVKQPDGSQVLDYINHRVMHDSTCSSTELRSYTSGNNNGVGPVSNGCNGSESTSGMNLTRTIPQGCTARFIANLQGSITKQSLEGNECKTQFIESIKETL